MSSAGTRATSSPSRTRFKRSWQAAGGNFETAPAFPDAGFFACLRAAFDFPYGLYGLGVCVGLLGILIFMVMRMGYSDNGVYDKDRNLTYSSKGTYGTAGFMSEKEMKSVVDPVADVRKHHGIILGEVNGKVLCLPEKTRFNGNLAVYGASGSKKTRSFCMNMILQCASRNPMTSLIICDPKSELYEKSAAYLEDKGYVVRKFDLVTPGSSDSWNCLSEINGQELMAQLFCDVIIKNTGNGKGDHFWDNAEMNLLKALVLYVERNYPPERKNIGEVYKLLSMSSEAELNTIFDKLTIDHPAKAPYSIFKQSSESVRGGVIIGLGSRLQVFQNKEIREITSHNEIDAERMVLMTRRLYTRLGSEIDFIVKGIENRTRSIVASRKDAMYRKRQTFYMDLDVTGQPMIYEGRIVQARVVAVAERVIRVEVFGVECNIRGGGISRAWYGNANENFSVGDTILVRVLTVNRPDIENIQITADIRSVTDEDSANINKCVPQGHYVGRITDIRSGVFFIRLNNGVNAVAHSSYDFRSPGKKDDVSFVCTRIDPEHNAVVGIITRIIRQNL